MHAPMLQHDSGMSRHQQSDAKEQMNLSQVDEKLLRRRVFAAPPLVALPIAAIAAWALWGKVLTLVALALPAFFYASGLVGGMLVAIEKNDTESQPPRWGLLVVPAGIFIFFAAGRVASPLANALAASVVVLPMLGWYSVRAARELGRRKQSGTR